MFEIDLSAQDDGVWFDFLQPKYNKDADEWDFVKLEGVENGNGPKLKVRDPLQFINEKINSRKKIKKTVWNPKTHTPHILVDDEELSQEERKRYADELNLYMLEEFSGFKDKATGKEIECNEKTRLAMAKHPDVDRNIVRAIRILRGIEAEKSEEEKKTSSTQQNG